MRRDQRPAVMQPVKVFANYDRIEEGEPIVTDQNWNLAERIGRKHGFIAARRARLVVENFQSIEMAISCAITRTLRA